MSHAEALADIFATDPPKPPERKPATVRADWTPPTETCSECGRPMELEVYHNGEGWTLLLVCPDDCTEGECRDAEWPFVEDRATASDFEAAGWVVS